MPLVAREAAAVVSTLDTFASTELGLFPAKELFKVQEDTKHVFLLVHFSDCIAKSNYEQHDLY